VEVTGLPELVIEERGDTTRVRAGALTLALIGVEIDVDSEEKILRVTLPRPSRR